MKIDKTFKQKIYEGLLVLFIALAAVVAANFLLNLSDKYVTKTNAPQPATQTPQVAALTPYQQKDTLKKVEIVSDFKNSSVNNVMSDYAQKRLIVNGTLADGYLYVRANVNGKPLTSDDGVYVKLDGYVNGSYQELGGHLITSKSLDVPTDTNQTELLYPLSDIKYKISYIQSDLEVYSGDWLNLLNQATNQNILAFSSTSRSGDISEISIYYECAQGSNCSITVQ